MKVNTYHYSIFMVAMCLFSSFVIAGTYGGGNGSPENPYQIWDAEHMNTIGLNPNHWEKHFKLMDDIDMSTYTGTQYNIIGNENTRFTGYFDGNGHTINNLNYYTTSSTIEYVGLFGRTNGCIIKDVGLENISITTRAYFGGGLIAWNENGVINNCYANGSINGMRYIGGLVGVNDDGALSNCYVTGSVSATNDETTATAGGLVALNRGMLVGCYVNSSVTGSPSHSVGGLAGENSSLIVACYAKGTVHGTYIIGGLVGTNTGEGTIASSYAVSAVHGTDDYNYIGGLVGTNYGLLTACFWNTQTCGTFRGVFNGDRDGVIGATTSEMQTLSTFTNVGWDFAGESANGLNDYWQMNAGNYPRLMAHSWSLLGDGSSTNPYLIRDIVELGKVWLRPSACYRLCNNLDLSGISWSSAVVPIFSGKFEGQRLEISNLEIVQSNINYVGFFGQISDKAKICNLGLDGINIEGHKYIGGISGFNSGASLSNCFVTGSINGDYTVGGLIGENWGLLNRCYSSVNIMESFEGSGFGGLVGENRGGLSNCYASGLVFSNQEVGGLVGINLGEVASCYSTAVVNGMSYVGGFIGWDRSGTLTNCFWNNDYSMQFVGVGRGSQEGLTGISSDEMKIQSTFTNNGWDFLGESTNGQNGIWRMCIDGVDYPRLSWEFAQNADFACGDGLDMLDLQALAEHWLLTQTANPTVFSYACDANGDGVIDMVDYSVLGENWQ